MKKQFLSVLAFSAILLSSCGGTAKIERVSACGQKGEITASSTVAVAETESGKVAGYDLLYLLRKVGPEVFADFTIDPDKEKKHIQPEDLVKEFLKNKDNSN